MISSNTNHITSTEIIGAVYDNWKEKPRKTKPGQEGEVADSADEDGEGAKEGGKEEGESLV